MKYILNPYLPRNQVAVFGGSSGAGKTTLLFQMLDKLRRGEGFKLANGEIIQPDRPIKFLYVATDRELESYLALFERLKIEPFPIFSLVDHQANLLSKRAGKLNPADYVAPTKWLNFFGEIQQEENNDLFLFDTSLAILPIENYNSQKHVQEGMTQLAAWCKVFECATVNSMHTNKVKKNEDFLNVFNRISGSHGLLGYASTKMLLISELESKDAHPTLHLQGQHFADTEIRLRRDKSNGSLHILTESEEVAESYELLKYLSESENMTIKSLCLASEMSRATVYRHIQQLQNLGYVDAIGRGLYKKTSNRIS